MKAPSLIQVGQLLKNNHAWLQLKYWSRLALPGSILILLLSAILAWQNFRRTPENMAMAPDWMLLTGIAILIFFLFLGLLVRWMFRKAETSLQSTEKMFPLLGWRFSTCQETSLSASCPDGIAEGLGNETLSTLKNIPLHRFLGKTTTLIFCVILFLLSFGILTTFVILKSPWGKAKMEKLAQSPESPKAPFRATLKITEPAKDQWATKIEAIPLSIESDSPNGFQKLRVRATVDGGAPVEIALEPDQIPSKRQNSSTALFLDELPLKDYDLVTYTVVGDALRPGSEPVEITSEIFFVQIRPFKKDVTELESQGGGGGGEDAAEMINMLFWLIEEERRTIRGTWLLKGEARENSDSLAYKEASKTILATQNDVEQKARDFREKFFVKMQEKLPAEVFILIDKAIEEMDVSGNHLEKLAWDPAVTHEQRALSQLVEVLRFIQEVIQKQKGGGGGKSARKQETLKDRQAYRDIQELAKLLEEQEKVNRSMERTENSESSAQNQEMKSQQETLGSKAGQLQKDPQMTEKTRESLDQARKEMEKAAGKLQENNREQAGEAGKQAAEHLRQAQAHQASGRQDNQAEALQQMMREMAKMEAQQQSSPSPSPSSSPASQSPSPSPGSTPSPSNSASASPAPGSSPSPGSTPSSSPSTSSSPPQGSQASSQSKDSSPSAPSPEETAKKLQAMAEQLKSMSRTSQDPQHEKNLDEASQKTVEASQEFKDQRGTAETLHPPLEAVAKAYEDAIGLQAHLEELKQELANLEKQLQGLQHQAKKGDPSKSSPPAPPPGDPGKASSSPPGPPSSPGNSPGEGSNPGSSNSASGPTGTPSPSESASSARPGTDGQNPILLRQEAARQFLQALRERKKVLEAEISVAMRRSNGTGGNDFNLFGSGHSWGEGNDREVAYGSVGDWIKAVHDTRLELDRILKSLDGKDVLKAMQNEDFPPEFNEMVAAYFERLSREHEKAPPKAAPEK